MTTARTKNTAAIGVVVHLFVLLLWPAWAPAFCFEEAGQLYGINPQLLRAIARVESGLDARAVHLNADGSTDFGLMQINSSWQNTLQLCRDRLLSDACYNVKAGAKILKACIDRWGYTWRAVGCYNAASETRRQDYSWKIYSVLKKEKERELITAADEGDHPAACKMEPSLFFRIRAPEDVDRGENP